jgi:DNA-binding beta-propeller fold protein YncE
MRKIILILLIGLILFLTFGLIIHSIRRPSYSIKTTGKLYIVNKLSKSITVFDLFNGKEIVEFPIEIEPHEPTTLFRQNKVVVTNYGRQNIDGKSITVIDTKTNEIVNTIDLEGSIKPHGIVSFPESSKVGVVTDIGNDLLVVNVESGIVEKKIPTQQNFSHLLALHPNESLAYITNIRSNSVTMWFRYGRN